jgi:hyaluronoglucosaminidase
MPVATPAPAPAWRLGTIEGFFGRSWSWQARSEHVRFLAAHGFNSYVYAPKSDALLRKRWQTLHDDTQVAHLAALAAECRTLGIDFGIGLSPYELYRHFDAAHERLLIAKLEQLNSIGADTLCILFDDMTGDLAGLAARQQSIMDCVRQHSSARRFALCPTYYSSDPLLAKLFGSPPERYLEELGALLAPDIDIFWTGPKVISQEYPRAHLQDIAQKLQRKPLLWDNYPVNDAKRLTSFLHLLPFDRNAAELRELCSGHLANPMNQSALSQLPLHALASLYQGTSTDRTALLQTAADSLLPRALASMLIEDAQRFQHEGLEKFSPSQRQALLQRYEQLLPAAAALEVVDWLSGGYTFDPACLT